MYNIHLLPAAFGDSILIEYGEPGREHYILIDGGPYYVFQDILSAIKKIAPRLTELELLVVTHIDIDHIDGIVRLLNQMPLPFDIREIWFNGYNELQKLRDNNPRKDDLLGYLQAEYLSDLIRQHRICHNVAFDHHAICVPDFDNPPKRQLRGGMMLTLLSPGVDDLLDLATKWKDEIAKIGGKKGVQSRWMEETRYASLPPDLLGAEFVDGLATLEEIADRSMANRSSIAFLASYGNKTCLMAGDTPSDKLLRSIDPLLQRTGKQRLSIDAWKLAHHGSKKSTHQNLMEKIDCQKIFISTDGKRYGHPDAACIQQLLKGHSSDLHLFFNYRSEHNSEWDNETLKNKYNYRTSYPGQAGETGITVEI
jgi:beta-lactamase superfamily II metal-dependent hydrolase